MSWQAIAAAVLGCFLSCPSFLNGQTTPSAPGSIARAASAEQHYPEQAYLAPTRYSNGFFGFSFELPADAHLEPISQPVAADGRIQLLELGGPPPADAAVSIVAFPPRGQASPGAKALLRKALDQELFRGVEELRALSKTMVAGHQFYFYETRRGIDQHMLAAANLDGYVVLVELGAHNETMVKELESCFQHIVFFAPQQVRQYIAADAQPYEGPAISSHRLAQLNADPPESHIDPGKLEGGIYRNPALGFSYQLPPGWFVEPQGAVLPAIERARAKDPLAPLLDGGAPNAGAAERQLMKACSRTLFSVWAKQPGADGQIPYDDFGEVTVSALSAECLPGVKFPASSADQRALREFLLRLGRTHPILRDMADGEISTSQGMVFLLLHGSIGFKVPNDELSRRLSVAMAITERRGYLLTWFFAAPHDSDLEPLLQERVGFDPESATKDAGATKAASREAPGTDAAPPAAASANPALGPTAQAAAGSASGTGATLPGGGSTVDGPALTTASGQNAASNSSGTASGTSQPEGNPSSTPPATRPTLLRPGETIGSQQGKGPPIRKH
ncbi:MAG: hypothetical protein ACHP8B_07365 [Terriglobales bacterium]